MISTPTTWEATDQDDATLHISGPTGVCTVKITDTDGLGMVDLELYQVAELIDWLNRWLIHASHQPGEEGI